LAECDGHYDAETVGKWTWYQFRMYTCDKKMLRGNKMEFDSLEAAREAVEKMKAERLQKFDRPESQSEGEGKCEGAS